VRDLTVIVITLAFFGLCLAYVRWCDGIIGPDEAVDSSRTDPADASAQRSEALR
jgi:hypothetical protein